MQRVKNHSWIALLALLLISCTNKSFYNEYQSTNGEWYKDDVKKFEVEIKDTIQPCNLYINIRNNQDYPFSNLYVIVKTVLPKGKIMIDTLQYEMAKPDGELLGEGITGVKTSKLWFKEKYKFQEKGKYIFEIQHAMRKANEIKGTDTLKGVMDVGFMIEK